MQFKIFPLLFLTIEITFSALEAVDKTKIDNGTNLNPYGDLFYHQPCSCDLIRSVCEQNCPCDRDCEGNTDYYENRFFSRNDDFLCSEDLSFNKQDWDVERYFQQKHNGLSLFCISNENIPDHIVYKDDSLALSEERKINLFDKENKLFEQIERRSFNISATDIELINLKNRNLLFPDFTGNCIEKDSLDIFSKDMSCSYKFSNISAACEVNGALNSLKFAINSFQFSYKQANFTIPSKIGNVVYRKEDKFSSITNIQSPSFTERESSCVCNNVLDKMIVNFFYTDSFVFKEAVVDFQLTEITKSCKTFLKHEINIGYRFFNLTLYPDAVDTEKKDFPGQIGYTKDKELTIGKKLENSFKVFRNYVPLIGLTKNTDSCSKTEENSFLSRIGFMNSIGFNCLVNEKVTVNNCQGFNNRLKEYSLLRNFNTFWVGRIYNADPSIEAHWIKFDQQETNELIKSVGNDKVCRKVFKSFRIVLSVVKVSGSDDFVIEKMERKFEYVDVDFNTRKEKEHVIGFSVDYVVITEGGSSGGFVGGLFNNFELFFAGDKILKGFVLWTLIMLL